MSSPQLAAEILVLVADELRDDVARCVAAAGYRMLTPGPDGCRREWLQAGGVIADEPSLPGLAAALLPPRAGVVVVSQTEPSTMLWRAAMDLGATDVVVMPHDEGHLMRLLANLRAPVRAAGHSVALLPAHGGAGASTLAAAVALAAAGEQLPTMLLDVDDLGPGVDLLLGVEAHSGVRWHELALETGAITAQALRAALPQVDQLLSVLTGSRGERRPVSPEALAAVIDAGRAGGELVVVDLPRADSAEVHAALASVDAIVVVAAPSVSGCAAARVVVERLLSARMAEGGGDVQVALRGPAPGGLRPEQVADAIGLPLLTAYRPDPRLPRSLENGRLRVRERSPLGRAAREVYRVVVNR